MEKHDCQGNYFLLQVEGGWKHFNISVTAAAA
jgi:hypothetical protein